MSSVQDCRRLAADRYVQQLSAKAKDQSVDAGARLAAGMEVEEQVQHLQV